jgi:hypothetical protein
MVFLVVLVVVVQCLQLQVAVEQQAKVTLVAVEMVMEVVAVVLEQLVQMELWHLLMVRLVVLAFHH